MPGPVSESFQGPPDDSPYVPSWCFPNNAPKVCPCGHHEGYHGDDGRCLQERHCGCLGLPNDCRTADDELFGEAPPLPGGMAP